MLWSLFIMTMRFMMIGTQWISPNTRLYTTKDGAAVGSHNGTVYIIGGYYHQQSVTKFDVNTNAFIEYDDKALSSKIWLFGWTQFYTQQQDMLFILHRTDPTNSIAMYRMSDSHFDTQWNSINVNPRVGAFGCLASSPDYLFVVGGADTSYNSINTVQVVSLTTFVWLSNVTPLIQKRRETSCIVHKDKLYAFGGYIDVFAGLSEDMWTDTNERIGLNNILNGSWQYIQPLATKLSSAHIISWRHYIYIVGGKYDDTPLDSVYIFNSITEEISLSPNRLSYTVQHAAVIAVGDSIYAFGGEINLEDPTDRWMHTTLVMDSSAPTSSPSDTPSAHPSAAPSDSTSADPTDSPSADPTGHPSSHPATSPSDSATTPTEPSADPSADPSPIEPSVGSSVEPSADPSSDPTATATSSNGFVTSDPPKSDKVSSGANDDDSMSKLLKWVAIVLSLVIVLMIVSAVIVCKLRKWKKNMMQDMNEKAAQSAADSVLAMQMQMAAQMQMATLTAGAMTNMGTEMVPVQTTTVGGTTMGMCDHDPYITPMYQNNVEMPKPPGMGGIGDNNDEGEGMRTVEGGVGSHGEHIKMRSSSEVNNDDLYGVNKDSSSDRSNDDMWDPNLAGVIGVETSGGNEAHVTGQCVDCGEINDGKIYDADGQLYCNKCWMNYANADTNNFIQ
eukprot:508553_1